MQGRKLIDGELSFTHTLTKNIKADRKKFNLKKNSLNVLGTASPLLQHFNLRYLMIIENKLLCDSQHKKQQDLVVIIY